MATPLLSVGLKTNASLKISHLEKELLMLNGVDNLQSVLLSISAQ